MKIINFIFNRFTSITFITASIILVLYINYAPIPTFNRDSNLTIPHSDFPNDFNEGKKLALTICSRCHLNYDTRTLAGRNHGNPNRIGEIWSANITQDSITGIGSWTNEDLFYLFRTGIKKNGQFAYDMPKYPNLSDEDLLSLIAFLKSNDPLVKATDHKIPPPNFSLTSKALLHYWFKPIVITNLNVEPIDTNNLLEFGKYLSTAKYSCFECHSKNTVSNNYLHPEKSWKFFQGGNRHANESREIVMSSNLTPDDESGIGQWSISEFIILLSTGLKPDSTSVKDPMFAFPLLSKNEITAIYTYLKSLEAKKNKY